MEELWVGSKKKKQQQQQKTEGWSEVGGVGGR